MGFEILRQRRWNFGLAATKIGSRLGFVIRVDEVVAIAINPNFFSAVTIKQDLTIFMVDIKDGLEE